MDNKTFQTIKDILIKNQDIAVVVGPNPSLDQMAAGLGFYLVLRQMGKNAIIACPTNPIVALSSLVGIDKVQKNIGAADIAGDLTVSFPYNEGEIEKVSYTLDNGKLNIVVKAGEKGISFDQSMVQFIRASKLPTLLIFIGVNRLSDVASIYTPQAGSEPTIINMDNNANNERYGTIAVVDTKWSSVSEQVADFVTLLEPQIELDIDTAQNLFTGIDFATNDFTSPNTSYLAFEVAGILMKKGAKRARAMDIINASNAGAAVPNVRQYFPPPISPNQIRVQSGPSQPTQSLTRPQPVQMPPVPVQPVSQPAWQPPQAPISQPTVPPAPVVTQESQPQTPVTPQIPKQAPTPPDWLTPKVYKGSSIL